MSIANGRSICAIGDLELIGMPLLGIIFNWSNEREITTHINYDGLLVSTNCDLKFSQYQLSLTSSV